MKEHAKKVKLVTLAPRENYGSCLQSYALHETLRKMGYNVEFIYNEDGSHLWARILKRILPQSAVSMLKARMFPSPPPSVKVNENVNTLSHNDSVSPRIIETPNHPILKFISILPGFKYFYKWYKRGNTLRSRKIYKFAYEDGNYNLRRVWTKGDLRRLASEADVFITGSDQIWNYFAIGFIPLWYLEIPEAKKRVAYSSSLSQSYIHPAVKERVKEDLSKFSHIGVREEKTVELLNDLLQRNDVRLVVDPVCLLSDREWIEFGKRAKIEFELPEKYIFCYFANDGYKEIYKEMTQAVIDYTGIKDVIILDFENRTQPICGGRVYRDASPYEWIYLLNNASYVCTNSFHCSLFSMKLKKEFVICLCGTKQNGFNIRIYDIMSRYGIENKIYEHDGADEWKRKIDFSNVMRLLDAEIEDCMKFLKYEIEE